MTSYLTPFVDGQPVDLGRLRRKQVLKFGKVRTNDGTELDINHDLANACVEAYKDGAFDQVPFVLANSDNQHTSAPERFRGEIKGFEVTADGLDMLMEPSASGDALLDENPRLGVSARIVPNYTRSDGKTFKAAIEHVAGTLNPVVTGMRPWQAVNLSSTDTGQVIDLSTEEYQMPDETKTDPETTEQVVVDDAAADQIVNKLDEESLAALKALLEADDDEGDSEEEPEPALASVGADLSSEAKAAIDLANSNAQAAVDRAAALELQLANERADREADAYKAAGVPPAMVDLARPALATTGQVIDLSNGQTTDSVAIIRGLLNESRGRIDLSREHGHTDLSVEAKKQHDDLMAAWDKDFPQLKK